MNVKEYVLVSRVKYDSLIEKADKYDKIIINDSEDNLNANTGSDIQVDTVECIDEPCINDVNEISQNQPERVNIETSKKGMVIEPSLVVKDVKIKLKHVKKSKKRKISNDTHTHGWVSYM